MTAAIGIDLGTAYCCAAIYESEEVRMIESQTSENRIPSHVTIDEDGTVTAGTPAKQQCYINPETSLFGIKRLIGRKFNDPQLQEDIQNWNFAVIKGENNTPLIRIPHRGLFRPEQITAKLLSFLKVQAEIFLSKRVSTAVITVPAYFNDGQRQATKDAAEIAGFDKIKIINEPTAAAIAFNHQTSFFQTWTNILVFDLGGGTFDISVLRMRNQEIEVIAVGGDTHLGGEDFDNALVEYCIQEFQEKEGINLRDGRYSNLKEERLSAFSRLRRLKLRCEEGKIALSTTNRIVVSLDAMYKDKAMHVEVTRDIFESLNRDPFDRCIQIMEEVLETANLGKYEIEEVILVGGSSNIPAIQARITEVFDETPIMDIQIKSNEIVAYGAAIQANIGCPYEEIPDRRGIKDVCPLSIGIEIFQRQDDPGNFNPIIRKNTPVPCRRTKKYYTVKKNTTALRINVFEGENPNARSNYLLGSFIFRNLPKDCPQGEVILVTMNITAEGILECTAMCPKNSGSNRLEVLESKGRLSKEEINRMMLEACFICTITIKRKRNQQ